MWMGCSRALALTHYASGDPAFFDRISRFSYTARMSNETWRLILAATVGPIFWGIVKELLHRHAAKGAPGRARKREEALERAHRFGRKLGRWCRELAR